MLAARRAAAQTYAVSEGVVLRGRILFQVQKFLAMPEFEAVSSGQAYDTASDAPAMPQLRLGGGASADTIKWPDLGYAAAYGESFEVFRGLQAEGTIPDGVRFQMQYPTSRPSSREPRPSCTSPWSPITPPTSRRARKVSR